SFVGTFHSIFTETCFPTQSAGTPFTVRVKVSQLIPSTHVLSSAEVPPVAVPFHVVDEPTVELTLPEEGLAALSGRANKRRIGIRREVTPLSAVSCMSLLLYLVATACNGRSIAVVLLALLRAVVGPRSRCGRCR